jgi:hypothetical protein
MSSSIVSAGADRNEQSLGTSHHFHLQFRELRTRRIERDMRVDDGLLTEEERCDQFGVSTKQFVTPGAAWRATVPLLPQPRSPRVASPDA